MLTKMMPSQRAQAAPDMTPKPAARTMRPTIRCHQPHVAALVVIQWAAATPCRRGRQMTWMSMRGLRGRALERSLPQEAVPPEDNLR